ncbi:MAG: DUF924 family protein [Betaproteobacteria bacterium]|nr:DUF924 family protein [Betaproteobacteria bacterium]
MQGGLPSSLGGFNAPTDVVCRRFGRDSHRNAILGRASCAKELAFAE